MTYIIFKYITFYTGVFGGMLASKIFLNKKYFDNINLLFVSTQLLILSNFVEDEKIKFSLMGTGAGTLLSGLFDSAKNEDSIITLMNKK
jgi:hypothetical protein